MDSNEEREGKSKVKDFFSMFIGIVFLFGIVVLMFWSCGSTLKDCYNEKIMEREQKINDILEEYALDYVREYYDDKQKKYYEEMLFNADKVKEWLLENYSIEDIEEWYKENEKN